MEALRIVAPLLTAVGSLLLALRVKMFLDAYQSRHDAAEANFAFLARAVAEPLSPIVQLSGIQKSFTKRTRWAGTLFFVGFALIITSALMRAYIEWLG